MWVDLENTKLREISHPEKRSTVWPRQCEASEVVELPMQRIGGGYPGLGRGGVGRVASSQCRGADFRIRGRERIPQLCVPTMGERHY